MSTPALTEKTFELLSLCAVPEVGPITARRLIRKFGSPIAALRAPEGELTEVPRVGPKTARKIKALYTDRERLRAQVLRLIEEEGVNVVTEDSDKYPEVLRQGADDAPLVLYMRGEVIPDDKFSIAVVGSRKATPYGLGVAEALGRELAETGFTVVSGLARGIDSASHRCALGAGGRSIGVMGSGIDVPYPAENKGLIGAMSRSGCVMSEFAPGTPPERMNFPRRNRLISGLSLGVIVVEADISSGALITADFALEQGREVFAVPGNINSPSSRGTNELIKRGARPVTGVDDIVAELAPVLKGFIKKHKKQLDIDMTRDEKALCDIMSPEPMHIDAISRKYEQPLPKVMTVLLGLELKGVVKQTVGKRFHLV